MLLQLDRLVLGLEDVLPAVLLDFLKSVRAGLHLKVDDSAAQVARQLDGYVWGRYLHFLDNWRSNSVVFAFESLCIPPAHQLHAME